MLLDQILFYTPCPIFWKDVNGIFLGGNKLFLTIGGFHDASELIGKRDAELPWKEYKDAYAKDDQYVIATGKTITRIENIPLHDRVIISKTTKTPLMHDNKIIGVLGICLDITAEKEAERLKLENEQHIITSLKAQAKFSETAEQVAHDIRSPVTALLMITNACKTIPEKERVALRDAATRVQDIANNLLNKHKLKEEVLEVEELRSEAILVSTSLLELMTEKKFQYENLPIKFETAFTQTGYFAFIYIEPSAFKRMISNLINNAVDAFESKPGKVLIKLDVVQNQVQLTVEDNGKGMPQHVVEKILQNIAITVGKEDGHGLGLCQVRETLSNNRGKLNIESTVDQGAKIILTFPRIQTPPWIAEQIVIGQQDLIVIVDDDVSIHTAWDTRFGLIKQTESGIQLKHFEQGQEALDFINTLTADEKEHVVLLADYELLNQNLNGLDVIEKSNTKRSILVTSHYANQSVREHAANVGTKILPKEMASEVPIKVSNTQSDAKALLKKVDLIIVEDDEVLGEILYNYFAENNSVMLYQNPNDFLRDIHQYPKDTKISLDNDFGKDAIDGLAFTKQLHDQGYTNLYMLSGKVFHPHEIPAYLTFIMKGDLKGLERFNLKMPQ